MTQKCVWFQFWSNAFQNIDFQHFVISSFKHTMSLKYKSSGHKFWRPCFERVTLDGVWANLATSTRKAARHATCTNYARLLPGIQPCLFLTCIHPWQLFWPMIVANEAICILLPLHLFRIFSSRLSVWHFCTPLRMCWGALPIFWTSWWMALPLDECNLKQIYIHQDQLLCTPLDVKNQHGLSCRFGLVV